MPFELHWDEKLHPDWHDPWGIWLNAIVGAINTYEDEIRDEIGDFTIAQSPDPNAPWQVIATGARGGQYRMYMSDHHADAHLCIDDYFPDVTEWLEHPTT